MKQKQRPVLVCKTCGVEFKQRYSYRTDSFCSKECWEKRSPQIEKTCQSCGKQFSVYKSESKRKHFCSKNCYSKIQQTKTGEKSHLWKGGKTKLSQIQRTRAIYRHWRTSVFVRDSHTCQICGAKNGNGKRIYLNAHHIETFAYNELKRFEISNGVTLCRECHIKEHPHLIAAKRIEAERKQLKLF